MLTVAPHKVYTLLNDKSNLARLRQLLENLTGQETDLERFFQLSAELFAMGTREGHFTKVNHAWTVLLGWELSDLYPPHQFWEYIHPDDIAATEAILKVMETDYVQRFVNRWRHKEGHYVALDWNTTLWTDGVAYGTARPVVEVCYACPSYPKIVHEKTPPAALVLAGLCVNCPHRENITEGK